MAAIAEATAPITMCSSLNQSLVLPSSSTYSSAPRKIAIEARPHQSNFLNRPSSGLSKSMKVQVSVATMMPGMTLTRNSQCQEKAWLR
ncbi:hypothetical protein D9M70_538560 [compost metagenome]